MKYTQQQWQMRHMLNDVVNHFSKNPEELRSITDIGRCYYNPPAHKPKSIGCAIGMYLPKDVCLKLDKEPLTSIDDIVEGKSRKLLPKWMLKLDPNFLWNIQRLHDSRSYWDKKGLSELGKEKVKEIITMYKLPKTIYK